MNSKDFAIGILSVTAVVLLTAFVLVQAFSPATVLAGAAPAAGAAGQYIVTVGQLDDISELVYVLDTASQRMNVYGLNPQTNALEIVEQLDVRPAAARPALRR